MLAVAALATTREPAEELRGEIGGREDGGAEWTSGLTAAEAGTPLDQMLRTLTSDFGGLGIRLWGWLTAAEAVAAGMSAIAVKIAARRGTCQVG
jgi:hypothetical protein